MNRNVFAQYFALLDEEFKITPSDIAYLISENHKLTFQGTKGVLSHLINRTRLTTEGTMAKWFDYVNEAVLEFAGAFFESGDIAGGEMLLNIKARMRHLVKILN